MWSVKEAIHASGLRYHKEKVFHDRPAEFTGVIVNGEQLAAPNRQLKKIATLRTAIRTEDRRGLRGADTKQLRLKLGGLQGQIGQISSQMRRRPPQAIRSSAPRPSELPARPN